jgi:hypothetical protein
MQNIKHLKILLLAIAVYNNNKKWSVISLEKGLQKTNYLKGSYKSLQRINET